MLTTKRIMATTYNNLYMDIRQELHCAGIDAATLEARELVAFAAGKTRQELLRECGFRAFCTFREMKPVFHDL